MGKLLQLPHFLLHSSFAATHPQPIYPLMPELPHPATALGHSVQNAILVSEPTKMNTQLLVYFALSVLFSTTTSFGQEPGAELATFRDAFIRDFPRIGLNSTPGDAMFLRIMIESTN